MIDRKNRLIAALSVMKVNSFYVCLLILFLMCLLANTCFVILGSMMEDVCDLNKEVAPVEEPMVELNAIIGRFLWTILFKKKIH